MSALDRHIKSKKFFRKINSGLAYCEACEEQINIRSTSVKHCIVSHEKSKRHIGKLSVWSRIGGVQGTIPQTLDLRVSKFDASLARFLNGCNIPWTKASTRAFKNFFKDIGYPKLPDESSLRRYLPRLYHEALGKIRESIGESWIYLQIDESRIADRAIVSILVGRLDSAKPISHLLHIVELDASVNNVYISQIVNDSINLLWPDKVYYDRFRLLLSDQAKYMLKAGNNLKVLYPNLLHVTCVCHALHRVCEKLHADYQHAKKFVEQFSRMMARCPRRQNR